ncbi:hypothetical protein J5Y04_31530 [Kitasatospora sp. RG8]|uniref:hypothetical protein n=1 Tax=Kitasatospora sp. RG8 TaxID=2820815 RepID=UPI001ADF5F8F|nr:hypothetical protein [Kitasatospora sp. RG8]MBP0454039.1 hypothetical protein [Kitasatospora sp. RG8]
MTGLAAVRDQAHADSFERLAALLDATSPATRARQARATVLPVLESLAPLLPHGGLAKGSITEAADMSLSLPTCAALAPSSSLPAPGPAPSCAWT